MQGTVRTPRSAFDEALVLHREGRLDEAAKCYEAALLGDQRDATTLLHLGILRLSQSRISDAEKLLRQALSLAPDSAEVHANLGVAFQMSQRFGEAVRHFEAAIVLKPTLTEAQFGLAACLQALGRYQQAVDQYRKLLEADSEHAEANYGLATLLSRLGQDSGAIAHYRNALMADPDFVEAHHGLGVLLTKTGDLPAAIGCFRKALDIDPEYGEVRMILGKVLQRLERDDEAIGCYREHLARNPNHAPTHFELATIFARKRPLVEAVAHYERALALEPECAAYMTGLASALRLLDKHKDAVTLLQQAIALEPDNPDTLSLLGRALVDAGELEQGLSLSRRAFELARQRPEIGYNLVCSGKVAPGDPLFPAMEAMLPRIASFTSIDQCCLYFALAKAYEDIGQPSKAFEYLRIGNSTKRRHIEYDEGKEIGFLERIERVFAADVLGQRRGVGHPSKVPIFIVGMPRSGTTLVEQILASHPMVYGAGERAELPALLSRIAKSGQAIAPFPEILGFLGGPELYKLGKDYVESIRLLAPDAQRIADKRPTNFAWVGLIHSILPDARIIHVIRDPVDTCLSCFSQLFAGALNFAYDLGELGRYYRAYSRLMAHWRAVLPQKAMLEIHYESLVANFPEETRRLIDYCDLTWDPVCLSFYKTSRTVRTASVTQVRKPIYSTSVGRWRPNEEVVRPLVEGLRG